MHTKRDIGIDYSVYVRCHTTDTLSPGHTVLWLPPYLIQAQPCPFLYVVQSMTCWPSSWSIICIPLNNFLFPTTRNQYITVLHSTTSSFFWIRFPFVSSNVPKYIRAETINVVYTASCCSDLESLRTCYEGVFEQSCGTRSAEVIGELIKKAFEDPRYLRFKYRADCSLHNSQPDVAASPRVRHGSSTKRASIGTRVRNNVHVGESTSGGHLTVAFSGLKLLSLVLVLWRLLCSTWSTNTFSECDGWILTAKRIEVNELVHGPRTTSACPMCMVKCMCSVQWRETLSRLSFHRRHVASTSSRKRILPATCRHGHKLYSSWQRSVLLHFMNGQL